MRITFDAQSNGNFAGVNIVEPENWVSGVGGSGYDFNGAANLVFDIKSPDAASVQIGTDGCTSSYLSIPVSWTTMVIPLSSLGSCSSDFSNFSAVHILFSTATNDLHAPKGATVLVDNIRLDPPPLAHSAALGFPLGTQTFGIVPSENAPIGSDQVLRNVTTAYESSLVILSLLEHDNPQDLANAREIADTFDYALHHDSHGDPIPLSADGSVGVHNGYESGDISLFSDQPAGKGGKAGDVRLAGFTATGLCPETGFCLVLDGAAGGNNAFTILALVASFEQFQDIRYLNDAALIGDWIVSNLSDTTGTGYGGYYLGYPDMGVPPPKPLQTGKSVENNADIFAALQLMATAYDQLGDAVAEKKMEVFGECGRGLRHADVRSRYGPI